MLYDVYMKEKKEMNLVEKMLKAAEELALEVYGCDLEYLDPSEVEWYSLRVDEVNFEMFVDDLAQSAWMAS